MATIQVGGGIGLTRAKLQNFSSKAPTTPFLGRKLKFRDARGGLGFPILGTGSSCAVCAMGIKLVDAARDLFVGVGVGLPCTVMECGDIIYRSTLSRSSGITLTAPGVVLAMGALSYLWATPGVAPGFFDMFVLAFS